MFTIEFENRNGYKENDTNANLHSRNFSGHCAISGIHFPCFNKRGSCASKIGKAILLFYAFFSDNGLTNFGIAKTREPILIFNWPI